jgi:transcriptional regulator with XRE-family HTH domain
MQPGSKNDMLETKPFTDQPVLGKHHTTDDAGQKLRRTRERLNLRVRDVENASQRIAEKYHNDEFTVLINRISEIENRGLVPSVFKLYSLCAIYRLDFQMVLEWYGIQLAALPSDFTLTEISRTHPIGFQSTDQSEALLPLALDPGIDIRRTTYLSRMIQRWGRMPLMFLAGLDLKDHRYAFVGSDDWFMYPLLQPGSFLLIDETRRRIVNSGWTNEFERPIYFLEHRQGYALGWCNLDRGRLILQPHPSSGCNPSIYSHPAEIEVIGQVTGVAMRLDQGRRRSTRS